MIAKPQALLMTKLRGVEMRLVGTIPRHDHAERFQDFLIAQGKKCSLDDEANGAAVWVHDDDDVEFAKAELATFLQNPDGDKYVAARAEADAALKAEAARRKAARRNTVHMSRRWSQGNAAETPVTIGILVICVFVFAETYLMGDDRDVMKLLFISTDGTWKEIQSGEWWRIFTPAIMHGGPLHIFFNLMWWWDLGRMIEARKGSLTLFLMTLVIAAFSNVLQFENAGPFFLGLSGVVFGLFGYVWVKGRLDPSDGIGISQQSAMWMLAWFVLCCTGMVGRIANWAHAGGLMMGITLGAVSAGWRHYRRRI